MKVRVSMFPDRVLDVGEQEVADLRAQGLLLEFDADLDLTPGGAATPMPQVVLNQPVQPAQPAQPVQPSPAPTTPAATQ